MVGIGRLRFICYDEGNPLRPSEESPQPGIPLSLAVPLPVFDEELSHLVQGDRGTGGKGFQGGGTLPAYRG